MDISVSEENTASIFRVTAYQKTYVRIQYNENLLQVDVHV
jgi:hypothetical protein